LVNVKGGEKKRGIKVKKIKAKVFSTFLKRSREKEYFLEILSTTVARSQKARQGGQGKRRGKKRGVTIDQSQVRKVSRDWEGEKRGGQLLARKKIDKKKKSGATSGGTSREKKKST